MLFTRSLLRARKNGRGRAAAVITALALVFASAVGGIGAATADATTQNAVLSIDKSTVATTVLPGDTFVWEMQVGCASLETICVNASLHDSVPADFRVQDVRIVGVTQNATVTQGAYDATNGTPIDVAFNETSPRFPGIHGITDGQKLSVLVTVLLPTSTPASEDGVAVTNWGSVSADNAATQKDDSTVTLSVPATVGVDLTKKWLTANQIADPTATNQLKLTVQNTSNITASTITVVDPKAGTANPFDSVQFVSFDPAFTLPAGASTVAVTALTGGSSTTGPPSATPVLPTLPAGTTAADITGFTFAFASSSGEKILPFGTAGSIVLNVKQRPTVSTSTTTTVSNTAIATVSTPRGTATDDATDSFAIAPLTASVSAAKTFAPTSVLAGATSVVSVKGTNTSNTTLDSLTVTEPAASLATNPFASDLVFSGFGAAGDGSTTTGGHWPTGATSAKVTYTYSDASTSNFTLTANTLDGWTAPTAGKTVVGFTAKYTGAIATGQYATVPFLVTTKSSTAASVLNRVQVDGAGPGGTATPATSDATLTVNQPTIVSTINKTLTSGVNVAGQEVVATLSGNVSSANVQVRQLVLQDSPGTFSNAFSVDRVSSTLVPLGSTLNVQITTDGVNYTTVGGPYAGGTTVALDLSSTHATGVRFVFDAVIGTSFSATNPTAFAAHLVFTLKVAQAANALTWKNCATSTLAADAGVTGGATAPSCASITLGTGTTPTPVLSQMTSKAWGTSQVLIPNDLVNGTYPSTSLTLTAKNTSPLNASEISLNDATGGTTPFNYFDVTKITSIAVPTGADASLTHVQLLDRSGATVQDLTGSAAVATATGLTAANLANVYSVRVSVDGVFAPNAQLQVKLAVILRSATRTDGTPITAATAGALKTINNTVTGVVSDGTTTISQDASKSITVIPAAASALTATLSKTLTPSTGTIYSADPNRSVALALGVAKTAGNPTVLVVQDTSPTFWNAFDFTGVTSVTGTATSPNANFYARIDYLVGSTFSSTIATPIAGTTGAPDPATGTWKQGTEFLLPSGSGALTSAQKELPAGVQASDVEGIRITYTAKNGATWLAASVNGFSGQLATFSVVPRPTLRSGGVASNGGTSAPNPGEGVHSGTVSNLLTGTALDTLRPTPVALGDVPASFTLTPGNQSIVISKTPKASAVVPGEETPFKLSVSNTGSTPLVDPVLTDIIPWDAKGALLQYNPVQYTAASFAKTPSTASITTDPSEITVTTTDVVVSGAQTTQIAFSFPAGTVILPGESYVLTLPMQVRAGVERNTVFDNTFLLTAAGSYRATDTAQVTVLEGGSYARIKDVQENVPAGEQPTGNYNTIDKSSSCVNDGGFYRVPCLVETRPSGTETWRLRVINTGNLPTTSMTMVDVFPKAGDTGISKQLSALSRGSLWTPIFLGELDYTSLPAGTNVTVWYQTAAQTPCVFTGDPASSDPLGAGCDSTQWIRSTTTDLSELSNPSKVTAIKIQFGFSTELQPGDQVAVTYQTQTPDRLPSGVPAYTADGAPTPSWDSFVAFTTTDKSSGPEYESLEPNKAGIGFATPVAVGDYVWIDANGNGRQDSGEPGLKGVTVKLFDATDKLVGTTTTDATGHYLFDSLYPGDYHAGFTLTSAQQAEYRFTDEVGTDTTIDSNADKLSGVTDVFHLDAADVSLPNIVSADDYTTATGTQITALFIDPSIDAGVVPNTVSVGDYVWDDVNKDGIQDSGEPGIKGVVLSIVGPDGNPVVDATNATVGEVTTDADGKYEFTGLPVLLAGQSYTVKIDFIASVVPLFSMFSSPIGGTADTALDSSRNSAASGDLTADGDSDQTLDFGFYFADLATLPFDPHDPVTLAFTGIIAGPILGWMGALLGAGLIMLVLPRRRRGRHA